MKRSYRIMLMLCVCLAGCAQIPSSGPIQISPQHTQASERVQELQPLAPPKGAKPELIVQGFLHAMAEGHGNYALAREYLTTDAAQTWDPAAQTLIYSDDSQPPKIDPVTSAVMLKLFVVARLDSRGSYTRSDDSRTFTMQLLQTREGEWRISNPPPGLLLSETLFRQAFSPMALYFFDRAYTVLIPDIFYVPTMTITPNVVVRQLVRGPSQWAAAMTATAVPAGGSLGSNGISVAADGTVTVDFSKEIAPLEDARRTQLAAQIGASLERSFRSGVRPSALRFTQEGTAYALPGQDALGAVNLATAARFMTGNVQISRELFGIGEDNKIYRIRDLVTAAPKKEIIEFNNQANTQFSELALSTDASQIALVGNNNSMLYVGTLAPQTAEPKQVFTGTDVLRPQYTRFGDLWTMATAADGTSQVLRYASGTMTTVSAPGLVGVKVSTFGISPDGTRMIVVGMRGDKAVVGEVQILRDG
ncbi:MAG: LpqB family beta-propeller domain-containing protein, partial [Propionibacteriaceae bacterium]